MTIRLLGVGAAAPRRRLAAADIAAAWGRGGGRGQVAVCPPDEDTLTLAWEAGTAALDAAGIEASHVDALVLGHGPAPVRRRSEPRHPRGRARLHPTRGRHADRGIDACGHGRSERGGRCGRGRFGAGRARDRLRRAAGPARAPDSRRVRARARRRSCSRRRVGAPVSVRGSRAPARFSIATAATARTTSATSTTVGSSARRSSSRWSPKSRARSRRSTSGPGPFPIRTVASARPSPSSSAAARPRRPRSTPQSATPARPRRCSARSAHSTRPGSSRSSARAAGARPVSSSTSTLRSPAPRS